MIAKDRDSYEGKNKLEKAGIHAEEKIAWYLKRSFGKSSSIHVFNDLRLKFDDNDYLQVDHLVLHPHGFIFIESKSVSSTVKIDKNAYWERLWEGSWSAMPSPLKQVQVQADSFRQIIEEQTLKLREKTLFGLIQRRFDACPFDVIVAISDNGKITGNKSKEVMKAESVCDYIKEKISLYKRKWKKGTADMPVHFRDNEPKTIKSFLLNSHQSRYIKQPTSKLFPKKQKDEIKEPKKVYKSAAIKYEKPPFLCQKCKIPFDIRYKYNHYLYCQQCRAYKPLEPHCLQCNSNAKLKLIERIITYKCTKNVTHHGIFYKNSTLWIKDKNKLESEKT